MDKGSDEEDGYYNSERFVAIIKDQFTNFRKSGYYDWSGVRYLLYEYEEHLQKNEPSKVKWKTPNSIEHIYPQDDSDALWKEAFRDFTKKQKHYLCHSIGNLVLLRGSKNSQLSNKSFPFKRSHNTDDGSISGFINGSHSEIEVAHFKDWNAKNIYTRGKRILKFLQERWGVSLTAAEVSTLLLADDQLIEK
jgi:hypothetical protein